MSNKRRSINVEGFSHGTNPIPAASQIGNIIFTGGITGQDRSTHTFSDDPAVQVAQMFKNLATIITAAGGSPADIIKVSISVKAMSTRDAINKEWLAMFPDEASRPARHVTQYDHFNGAVAVQCEAYAVLSS
jgi:2-iminobutanoate/2-iminopropanoate deaminase